MKQTFTLVFWLDEGMYIGELKELPNVFSQAETLEELEKNIQEVYSLMYDDAILPPIKYETKEILLEV